MIEVGIIEHDGHRHAAWGATCNGRQLTCYLRSIEPDRFELTNWQGHALCELRCVIGDSFGWNEFGDRLTALAFRCGYRRWIIGASMGDGMLFRGEACVDADEDDALRWANQMTEQFAELDEAEQ